MFPRALATFIHISRGRVHIRFTSPRGHYNTAAGVGFRPRAGGYRVRVRHKSLLSRLPVHFRVSGSGIPGALRVAPRPAVCREAARGAAEECSSRDARAHPDGTKSESESKQSGPSPRRRIPAYPCPGRRPPQESPLVARPRIQHVQVGAQHVPVGADSHSPLRVAHSVDDGEREEVPQRPATALRLSQVQASLRDRRALRQRLLLLAQLLRPARLRLRRLPALHPLGALLREYVQGRRAPMFQLQSLRRDLSTHWKKHISLGFIAI
uniref:RNA-binding protein 25 n=1 Tax=Steinernema glaseri TaxID=37863 RepID=A0A1I7YBH5_9BILA